MSSAFGLTSSRPRNGEAIRSARQQPGVGEVRRAGQRDELKTCDASSNPHLALGGLVLAGLDGLERELTLPEPAAHDPAHLDAEEARRSGIRPLPADQAAALDALEADTVIMNGLGDLLGRCVLATRRAEYAQCVRMGDEEVRRVTFAVL